MPDCLLILIVEGEPDWIFFKEFIWPKIKKYYPRGTTPIKGYDNEVTKIARDKRLKLTDDPEYNITLTPEKLELVESLKSRCDIWKVFNSEDDGLRAKKVVLKDSDSADVTVEEKRAEIRTIFPFLKDDNIAIAITELESWVIAGFDRSSRYGGPFVSRNPETLKKESIKELLENVLGFKFEEEEKDRYIWKFLEDYLIEEKTEYNFDYALEHAPSLKVFVNMLMEEPTG